MTTSTHIAIPVTLHLSQVAGARLAQRAAAAGKEMPDYVSALIESIVETPQTLAKISGPIHDRFLASGANDDELSIELEQAKHDMRAERRTRNAS
jgi:hypothetical protein